MPLIAVAVAAYLSGLLAGFGAVAAVALGVAVAALVVAALVGKPMLAALAVLVGSGVAVAHASRAAAERCARITAKQRSMLVELDDAAAPGAYIRGHLTSCRATVWIAVERGRAEAGSTAAIAGEPAPSARGVVVQHAVVAMQRRAGWLARWRTAAGDGIDSTFRSDAALARALLIADTRGLSPAFRDRFAESGLAHMLSISGLHVGLIAVALDLLFLLLGVGRRHASVASLGVIAFYVAMIGFPAPAVRAALMLGLMLISRLVQRPTSPWAILALGACGPVIAPEVVTDLGYQLSVIGVAALIAGSRLAARLPLDRLPSWSRSIAGPMIGTTVATMASAPLVAWTFGRVSLIAPVSNLFASPIIALAQPMLFCGMLLAPLSIPARLVADAAHPLLAALDAVASYAASLPHAAVHVAPSALDAILAAAVCCAILVACASRDWIRPAVAGMVAMSILIWRPLAEPVEGLTELHAIDVGQGDALALRTPHGHWVLFDAGRAWTGGDAGRASVIPYIARHGGGPVDVFVLSHPHTDHVGGAASVIRAFRPARYIDAGFPGSAEAYRASLLAVREAHVAWTREHPGDSLLIDGVAITLLGPDSAWTAALVDPNLASVVALVRVGGIRMLLTGDAEGPEEQWLLDHARDALRADVLKVAHHGSSTSSTPAFLAAVHPRLAIVSVGAGNSYGHPNVETVRAIAAAGAQVLRTDRLGSIVARTDGRRLLIEAGGERWELPPRSPPPSGPP